MKKTLWLVTLLLFLGSSITFAVDGDLGAAKGADGSETSPWLIEDFADFQAFCADSTKWAANVYTRLEADIDLDPELPGRVVYDRAPIAGNTDSSYDFNGTAFAGIFDGNGHAISNLSINGASFCGLFGHIESTSKVSNLGIENSNIISSDYHCGSLCGQNSGIITSCYSTNPVIGSDGLYFGGLCGYNHSGSIIKCYTSGILEGSYVFGGLCSINSYGTISECHFEGTITCGELTGGICGENGFGTITSCYTNGTISGFHYIGGICGKNILGTISDSNTDGTVTGNNTIGGIAGQSISGIISNCYTTGVVSGVDKIGGLVGTNGNETDTTPPAMSDIRDSYSSCTVTGTGSGIGGLVGFNNQYSVLASCYFTGNASGNTYVGGISGCNANSSVIFNCYSDGSISGYDYVGGLAGLNMSLIKKCYSNSSITSDNNLGGICGRSSYFYDNAKEFNCIWNIEKTPAAFGEIEGTPNNNINISGKTTAEMQMLSTYTEIGWDFDNGNNGTGHFWKMPEAGMPELNTSPLHELEGDGSKEMPYLIYNADDLFGINRYILNEDGVDSLLFDRYAESRQYNFRLMNDIDLEEYTFSNYVLPSFTGIFDGNGHVIKNIKIDGADACGFFGPRNGLKYYHFLDDLQIKTLGLANVDIKGKDCVGGFMGHSEKCDISNCYVTGTIESSGDYAGGIVGYMYDDSNIANCYSIADVSGNSYVGGLCGFCTGGVNYNQIHFSYSTGMNNGKDYSGPLWGNIEISETSNNFWDTETSGIVDPEAEVEDTDGMIGLTTAEMQTQSTFTNAGWDFNIETANGTEDIWHMPYNATGYPMLSWQKDIPGDIAGGYGVDMADAALLSENWMDSYTMPDLQQLAANWLIGK